MSTITVSNIKKTGETASRDVSGVAAAWVNFNGTGTVAIRDSVNVSSLIDVATAVYRLEFSNSFNNADYSYTAAGDVASAMFVTIYSLGSPNTENDITFRTYNSALAGADCFNTYAALHGDLA